MRPINTFNSRITKMIYLGYRKLQDPYYQGFAAQMSFYIMLSIVPTVVALSQILGIMDISLDFLGKWINIYVAESVSEPLLQLLSYRPAITSNIIMIVMAIWAASRAQFSMMRIANYTYSNGETTGGFFKERLRALLMMCVTLFTFAFVIVVLVYGELIFGIVFGSIFEGTALDRIWQLLRWPLAGALYFLVVSYTYFILPSEKLQISEIIPGSIFASVGMLVVTIVYSKYTSHAVNYDILYGSLASIVALMFWFFFISWVFFLGIVFNKVWRETREVEE